MVNEHKNLRRWPALPYRLYCLRLAVLYLFVSIHIKLIRPSEKSSDGLMFLRVATLYERL